MAPVITTLVILIAVFLLLVLPLEIQLLAIAHGRIEFKFRFKYLYFIHWEMRAGEGREQKQEGKDSGGMSALSRIYRLAQIKGLWSRTWLLIRRLSKRITLYNIESDLEISLGDDYYTGMLAGLLIPVAIFLNSRSQANIRLEPCFEERMILEGLIQGKIRVRPLRVLFPCLAFLCSAPVWQARKLLTG